MDCLVRPKVGSRIKSTCPAAGTWLGGQQILRALVAGGGHDSADGNKTHVSSDYLEHVAVQAWAWASAFTERRKAVRRPRPLISLKRTPRSRRLDSCRHAIIAALFQDGELRTRAHNHYCGIAVVNFVPTRTDQDTRSASCYQSSCLAHSQPLSTVVSPLPLRPASSI